MMKSVVNVLRPFRMVLLITALAAGSYFPGMSNSLALAQTPPVSDWALVFQYDFAHLELGDLREGDGLTINNPNGERGSITVVADSEVDSGRALHVATNRWPDAPRPSMSVRFPAWDIDSADVETIAFEYKIKHVSGTAGMYLYVNETGSDHRIILRPLGDGKLNWHASLDGYSPTTLDDVLVPGWNTIRVIANKSTRSGDIYINDMVTPVARSLPFQRPVDTWENIQFFITHETHANEIREAYYADIKVWAVD